MLPFGEAAYSVYSVICGLYSLATRRPSAQISVPAPVRASRAQLSPFLSRISSRRYCPSAALFLSLPPLYIPQVFTYYRRRLPTLTTSFPILSHNPLSTATVLASSTLFNSA